MKKKLVIGLMSMMIVSSITAFATESGATKFTKSGQHGAIVNLEAAEHRIKATPGSGTTKYTLDLKKQVDWAWDPEIISLTSNGTGTQYSRRVKTSHATHYIEAASISGAGDKSVNGQIVH